MKNFNKAFTQTPILSPISIEDLIALFRQIIQEELTQHTATIPVTEINHFQTPGLVTKPLYKMREVCLYFGVSRQTIYEWMRIGKLKAFKVRSRLYFLASDLQNVLK
ncbi:MAG: DNA-binding protein [Citrobacter freundii]|nr:MAG: DNA-binding protein [Citrobacter freundii]